VWLKIYTHNQMTPLSFSFTWLVSQLYDVAMGHNKNCNKIANLLVVEGANNKLRSILETSTTEEFPKFFVGK